MEFKFRADDHKSPSYQSLSSSSTVGFPSFLRGGFPGVLPVPITDQMPPPKDDILRELEKEQIRRDIISGELSRRRMLEEEVRRELMVEREMALRRNLEEKLSYEERVTMGFSHRVNVIPPPCPYGNRPLEEPNAFQNSRVLKSMLTMPPPFPQLVGPQIKPYPGTTNKDKLIVLAKPDPDNYEAKRKAEMPPPAVECEEQCPLGLMNKPKEEWSCALCQVSVTCERGFNDHLKGKKHKAKESALRMQKIGLDAKAEVITEESLVQKSPNKNDSKELIMSAGKTKAGKRKRKFKFWCEACQVGAFTPTVMESHQKGKKHIKRIKFCQNDHGSDPPTSTILSEATPLTKDADTANIETDQKTTDVLSKETNIMEMAEAGFPNSVESSSMAESSGDRVVGEEEL
ncbi:UBP1-associated proteins 1C-like isoform X2 [Senna tora]|uniref:UBP1-associated proteins 1C-like isoform X2 n=1 Tax=Senna tora TaxID=362788 RepID=A0A834X3Z1_9FABA|nr:UBP1-associated proteins 1C-like isoform X2 [Senna tora]